jgi:hypothetical protein
MNNKSIEFPDPIRAQLVKTINARWFAPSERATEALKALPRKMPEGEVQLIARDGGFGMYIEARIDCVDGRIALECFTSNRMSGDEYYRIWDDGSTEAVVEELSEEERGHDLDEVFDEIARGRGFMKFTTDAREINRHREGRSDPT